MGFLAVCGFESGAVAADEITVISGVFTYSTGTIPSGGSVRSATSTPATVFEVPFTAGKSEFWLHAQIRREANDNNNDQHYIGWADASGLLGRVFFQDATGLIQIEVNGSVVATSGSAFPVNEWKRVHIHVKLAGAGGWVKVYLDGDIYSSAVEFSGNTDPTTAGTADRFRNGLFNQRYMDDLIAMDPNDATGTTNIELMLDPAVVPSSPDGAGFYTTWSGAYTDIDEIPPSDADKISASAPNQASTFTHADVAAGKTVLGVKWIGKFLRSDTTAGDRMNIRRRRAAADTDTIDILVPGDGYIVQIFDEADGPSAWDRTKFNDTEWGPVSKPVL